MRTNEMQLVAKFRMQSAAAYREQRMKRRQMHQVSVLVEQAKRAPLLSLQLPPSQLLSGVFFILQCNDICCVTLSVVTLSR